MPAKFVYVLNLNDSSKISQFGLKLIQNYRILHFFTNFANKFDFQNLFDRFKRQEYSNFEENQIFFEIQNVIFASNMS